MRGTKFFGIGAVLAVCVLASLLALEAGLIPVAWAGKPEKPPGKEKPGGGRIAYVYDMTSSEDITTPEGQPQRLSGSGTKNKLPTSLQENVKRVALCFAEVFPFPGPQIGGMHVDCKDGVNVHIQYWFYPHQEPDNDYMLEVYNGVVSNGEWCGDFFEVAIPYVYIWDAPHVEKKGHKLPAWEGEVGWTLFFEQQAPVGKPVAPVAEPCTWGQIKNLFK